MLDKISDGKYQARHSCAWDPDARFLKLGSRSEQIEPVGMTLPAAQGARITGREGGNQRPAAAWGQGLGGTTLQRN